MSTPAVLPLRERAFWQDPYPYLAAARAQHRTALSHSGELVLIGADDLEAASAHPDLVPMGVAALDRLHMTNGAFRAWRALSLNAQVGEDHARLRALVGRAFSPRQVDRVRVLVRAHVHTVLDQLAARADGNGNRDGDGDADGDAGIVDVHHELGHAIPLFSICAFLGIASEDRHRIDEFMVGTEEGFSYPMTPEKQARADAGIEALYAYGTDLVERRRREPGDDLVTALVAAEIEGDRLREDELLAMVVNLIGGAVGSSDSAIANTVHLMATYPSEFDAARDDARLVPRLVEEILRFRPPFRSTRRKALAPLEIAGVPLAAGETVFLSRQGANRDPSRWSDADRFDPARAEVRHLAFGYGPHYCLGQALARLNLVETTSVLLERWSGVELIDPNPARVPFDPTERFVSLRVRPILAPASRAPSRP
jgi:cytochrome P450